MRSQAKQVLKDTELSPPRSEGRRKVIWLEFFVLRVEYFCMRMFSIVVCDRQQSLGGLIRKFMSFGWWIESFGWFI